MRLFHISLSLVMALAMTGLARADEDVQAKGKGKRAKHHGVPGVVIDVQKDKDKDTGTITVKVHQGKKAKQAPKEEGKEVKFQVIELTKFESVRHVGKGDNERKPATFADVKKGEHVVIIPVDDKPGLAKQVEIVHRAKKPKGEQQ